MYYRKFLTYKDLDTAKIVGHCVRKNLPGNNRGKYYAIDLKYKVRADREVSCFMELSFMFSPYGVRNKRESTENGQKLQWYMRFEVDESREDHRQFRNTWEKLRTRIHEIIEETLKKSIIVSDPIYLLNQENSVNNKLPSIYVKFDDHSFYSTKFAIVDQHENVKEVPWENLQGFSIHGYPVLRVSYVYYAPPSNGHLVVRLASCLIHDLIDRRIPKFSEHAMSKVASVTIEDRLKMEELITKNNGEIPENQ